MNQVKEKSAQRGLQSAELGACFLCHRYYDEHPHQRTEAGIRIKCIAAKGLTAARTDLNDPADCELSGKAVFVNTKR